MIVLEKAAKVSEVPNLTAEQKKHIIDVAGGHDFTTRRGDYAYLLDAARELQRDLDEAKALGDEQLKAWPYDDVPKPTPRKPD